MAKRWGSVGVAVAVAALGLGLSAPAASAAGVITPASGSVAAGRTLKFSATGCTQVEHDDDDGSTYRSAAISLITGTGVGERLAGFGLQSSETAFSVVVPRWVDPAQPAVLTGSCIEQTYDFETGEETSTTLFTYPDVAVDVTAPTGPLNDPIVTANRTTAAGGQVVRITGSGCTGYDTVQTVARTGASLGRDGDGPDYPAFGFGPVAPDGTFTVDLVLNHEDYDSMGMEGTPMGGPVAEGPYAVLVLCAQEEEDVSARFVMAEPFGLDVVGTRPSDAISVTPVAESDDLQIAGSGCTGGAEVTLHLSGYAVGDGFEELDQRRIGAQRTGDLGGARRAARDAPDAEIDDLVTVVPEADGTWSTTWAAPGSSYSLDVEADCGDPAAEGFRYLPVHRFEFSFSDLYVDRVSPTSSPVGGQLTIHAEGECDDGETTVALVDGDGEVVDDVPVSFDQWYMVSGTVTAPATPGTYYVTGTCDGDLGEPTPYEVFAPTPVAGSALPEEPTTGWPSEGARETYHGKIGPITLRADDDMGMEDQVAKALGSNGFFIDVPRPEGDFAITKLDFDLVDGAGTPVPQTDAHLHHFVIGNTSATNPACPDGTFGLPGQIVGAAGAERTVLDLPDPYGIVVDGTDDWTGVYELMGMADHDQTVYLTYDIDLRRDVENVRPITTYFGSATGCDSFTWTIDGSGTPDVQSHYLTIAKAGRLVGTGAHIHNGGMHTELVDDRDRVLCRSTLELGDMPLHHGHTMSRRPPTRVDDEVTATTSVGAIIDDGYPPEFYDDDLEIMGIDGCPLAESVVAGQRLRFDAVYENERARSGVMGIFTAYVWEGGGPAEATGPSGATPIPGSPSYTG